MAAKPGAEDARLTSIPGRLGQARGPDRHERGGRDGNGHRDGGPGEGHRGHPGQGQRGQPGAGHAEGAQDRELRRVQDQLAAKQLADDGQRDQPGQRGEDRQCDSLRADGPLGGGDLVGQVDDVEVRRRGG